MRWALMVAPVLLVVGLLLLGWGLTIAWQSMRVVASGTRVQGTITSVGVSTLTHTRSGSSFTKAREEATYVPIVAFTPADGRSREIRAEFGSSTKGVYVVGRPMPVLYLASDPEVARIATWDGLWASAAGVAMFGAFVLAMAVMALKFLGAWPGHL